MKKIRKFLKPICLLLLTCSYLLFLNRLGKFNIFYFDKEISTIQPDQGYAYLGTIGDPNIARGKLSVVILENTLEIRRDFSDTTESVREKGLGSFVIWDNGTIVFSASDNTDPAQNGRVYRIIYPAMAGNRFARFFYASTLLMCGLYLLSCVGAIGKAIQNYAGLLWQRRRMLRLWLVIFLPFLLFACIFLLRQPLWGDEIFTVKNYCLNQNILFSAITYDYPNNHIFLNLILTAYLRLLQVSSFQELTAATWILRLPFLVFSGLTVLFTMAAAEKMKKRLGILSGILLCTTLPFYAWGTQIRGYSLSFFLISLLIYLLFSYQQKPASGTAVATAIVSTLLIYTIPFNAIFVAASMFFLFAEAIAAFFSQKNRPQTFRRGCGYLLNNAGMKMLIALSFGVLFTVPLYFPVSEQLINIYLRGGTYSPVSDASRISTFFHNVVGQNFAGLWQGFFAGRLWLAVLSAAALIVLFMTKKMKEIFSYPVRLAIAVILIPFLFCGITGYVPFNRNFLPLYPVCVLLISFLLGSAMKQIFREKQILWVTVALFVCGNISFGISLHRIHEDLPNSDLAKINQLSEPYFLSTRLDPEPFLKKLQQINSQNLPVLSILPGDFYLYELCSKYDTICYDYYGIEAQAILRESRPFFFLRNLLKGAEETALPEAYQNRCDSTPFFQEGIYLLYHCGAERGK